MRAIKFRAWVTSSYRPDEPEMFVQGGPDLETLNSFFFHLPRTPNEGSYELMQFTGLLDKKGKEVYEGDVMSGGVLVQLHTWKPYFHGFGSYWLTCYAEELDENEWVPLETHNREVIGNVYENPELLKEEPA